MEKIGALASFSCGSNLMVMHCGRGPSSVTKEYETTNSAATARGSFCRKPSKYVSMSVISNRNGGFLGRRARQVMYISERATPAARPPPIHMYASTGPEKLGKGPRCEEIFEETPRCLPSSSGTDLQPLNQEEPSAVDQELHKSVLSAIPPDQPSEKPRPTSVTNVKRLNRLERFSYHIRRNTFVMASTFAALAAGLQLTGTGSHQQQVLWFSWTAGMIIGSMIGAAKVVEMNAGTAPRNVVITGSTRGLGKALAREFLRAGDNVMVASRSEAAVAKTVAELQADVKQHSGVAPSAVLVRPGDDDGRSRAGSWLSEAGSASSRQTIMGMACNVHSAADVRALANAAGNEFGHVDIWINNAGTTTGAKDFFDITDEELSQVVSTNLMGSLICTREAMRLMKDQPQGGHVFNMDGAGSSGSATPRYAAYGATKCALRQLHATLLQENKKGRVGIHTASPGMVLTDLLLSGATLENKQVFNIVCEQPETVAQALVPQIRCIKGTGRAINYLTPPRIALALVTAWLRRGRWFDAEGRAVYAAEADRLRMWAEGEQKSPLSAAVDLVPSIAWLSLMSSSAICAYVMLTTLTSTTTTPGM